MSETRSPTIYDNWTGHNWALLNRHIEESEMHARAQLAHDRKARGFYTVSPADEEAIELWADRRRENERMADAYDALADKPEWAAWVSWWPDVAGGMAADDDYRDERDEQNALRDGLA